MASEHVERSLLFLDENEIENSGIPVANGVAAVMVRQSPARSSGNQDAAAIIPVTSDTAVLAVADGVGGSPAGRQAAEAAIRALDASLSGADGEIKLRTAIIDGIEHANAAVLEIGAGAATTLAVVEVQGHSVRPYHVGDSGVLVTGQRGKLKLQTVSHSPVGFAVESGLIEHHEAIHHVDLHYISNVIGTTEMRIEVGATLELAVRDTLVIATDGLLDNLRIEEIVDICRTGPLKRVATQLADTARRRMLEPQQGQPSKPDDLTCILFRRLINRSENPSASA